MSLLNWLFGKKEKTSTVPAEERKPPHPTSGDVEKRSLTPIRDSESEKQTTEAREAENLRRWRTSGQARAWVEARQGCWDHNDWLALLEELKRSSYWPLRLEAIGQELETAKREWLRRN